MSNQRRNTSPNNNEEKAMTNAIEITVATRTALERTVTARPTEDTLGVHLRDLAVANVDGMSDEIADVQYGPSYWRQEATWMLDGLDGLDDDEFYLVLGLRIEAWEDYADLARDVEVAIEEKAKAAS